MSENPAPAKLSLRAVLADLQKRLPTECPALTDRDRDGLVIVAALLMATTPRATVESRLDRVLDALLPPPKARRWLSVWLREFADIVGPTKIHATTKDLRSADLRRCYRGLVKTAAASGAIADGAASVRAAYRMSGENGKLDPRRVLNTGFLLGADGVQRFFVTKDGRLKLSARSVRDALVKHDDRRRPRKNDKRILAGTDALDLLDSRPAQDTQARDAVVHLIDALDAMEKMDKRPAWRAAIHYLRNGCSRLEAAKMFGATAKALRNAEPKVMEELRRRLEDAG